MEPAGATRGLNMNQTNATNLPNDAESLRKLLAEAQAQIAAMKARGVGKVSCKVSEKGALSVYGLGRFPVTLYAGQWDRLLSDATVKTIREFMTANQGKLATKP
jgi:hypothetical protein